MLVITRWYINTCLEKYFNNMQVGIAIDDDYMIEFGESIDLGLKSGDFSDHCSSLVKHKSSPVHHSPEYVLTCFKKNGYYMMIMSQLS